jgi:hypothetical protein
MAARRHIFVRAGSTPTLAPIYIAIGLLVSAGIGALAVAVWPWESSPPAAADTHPPAAPGSSRDGEPIHSNAPRPHAPVRASRWM